MDSASTSLVPTPKQRTFLRQSIARYAETIEPGLNYLADRGVGLGVANRWELGVVVDPMPGHEMFAGRLAIPYRTPSGPSAIVFRCIRHDKCSDHNCPKYLAPEGQRRPLFNVHAFHAGTRQIVVCEGEFDALVSTALGGCVAVGVPGASKWEPWFRFLFDGFDEAIVCADGDEPGRKFAAKFAGEVQRARVVHMPVGEDVASYLLAHDASQFQEMIGWHA